MASRPRSRSPRPSLPPSVCDVPPSVRDSSGVLPRMLPASGDGADSFTPGSGPPGISLPPSDSELCRSASELAGEACFSTLAHCSDEIVELPPEFDGDSEAINGWDDAVDIIEPEEEQASLTDLVITSPTCYVPSPTVAQSLVSRQQFAELYSPPRVLPVVHNRGLTGQLSLDILTGWNFELPNVRAISLALLTTLCIRFLMLSPPCTIFSQLQRLWNFKRMHKADVEARWAHGMMLLTHAMDCARTQVENCNLFVFEHPATASSWDTEPVQSVAALPGVVIVTFDQCMVGLTSKVTGTPMRKRTKLMTNSEAVAKCFGGLYCDRSHVHQTIQGTEGGVRRSTWAQLYPPPMVNMLADCACQCCQSL